MSFTLEHNLAATRSHNQGIDPFDLPLYEPLASPPTMVETEDEECAEPSAPEAAEDHT